MATNYPSSRSKGNHGLGVLLEWIYSLPLDPSEQAVMIVYAKHADYWDGSNSRPSVPTVAKKARLKDRRVQQILRKLQADPRCERCRGTGNVVDEFRQTSRCDCWRLQRGYLVPRSPAGRYQAASYDLNVQLKISTSSTVSTRPGNGGVQDPGAMGANCTPPWVQIAPGHGCNPEHANKEDRKNRKNRFKSTNTAASAALTPQTGESLSHEDVLGTNFSPEHLQAWLAIKAAMRRHLSDVDWKLWVRPARLLRHMGGRALLIAVPANGNIMTAAAEGRALLLRIAREHGFSTHLTRYPDEYQIAKLREQGGIDYSRKQPAPAKYPRAKAQEA